MPHKRITRAEIYDSFQTTIRTPGVAQRRNGADRYFWTDSRGSTRHLTSTGNTITQSRWYDSFGNQANTTGTDGRGTDFLFAGEWGYQTEYNWGTEPGIGLHYLEQRYYDPVVGRFLTPDPIGWAGGLNLYGYVGNDPVNAVDPSGLQFGPSPPFVISEPQASGYLDNAMLKNPPVMGGLGNVVGTFGGPPGGVAGAFMLGSLSSAYAGNDVRTSLGHGATMGMVGFGATTLGQGISCSAPRAQHALAWSWSQRLTTSANARLAANPGLASTVLRPREYAWAQASPGIAPMAWGNAVERLMARDIENSWYRSLFFRHLGGAYRPDFVGRGLFSGVRVDVTTPGGFAAKFRRSYAEGLIIPTYDRPSNFTVFPP